MSSPRLADYVADVACSALAEHAALPPWELTARAPTIVTHMLAAVGTGFERAGDVVWHGSARIEQGAIVKGPAVIGPRCLVATGAYLRGGVWLEEDCVVGPHAEVKASLLFRGARLAHLNFVGDSILGRDVNVEAGAVIANRRNELDDPRIRLHAGDEVIDTGVDIVRCAGRRPLAHRRERRPGTRHAPGASLDRAAPRTDRSGTSAPPSRCAQAFDDATG